MWLYLSTIQDMGWDAEINHRVRTISPINSHTANRKINNYALGELSVMGIERALFL